MGLGLKRFVDWVFTPQPDMWDEVFRAPFVGVCNFCYSECKTNAYFERESKDVICRQCGARVVTRRDMSTQGASHGG